MLPFWDAIAINSPATKKKTNGYLQKQVIYNDLHGLNETQLRGDPHTLIVLTTTPVSEFIIIKCPSVLPTARATPNGWKLKAMHSNETCENKYSNFL